jgi:hypothetical protein
MAQFAGVAALETHLRQHAQSSHVVAMRMRRHDMSNAAARRRSLNDRADALRFGGTDWRVEYRHGVRPDSEAGVITRGRPVDTIRAVTERCRPQRTRSALST